MKSDSDLGPRIRALRLSRQLSLAEVAAGTGVSEATMSRIETGHSQVSARQVVRLAAMPICLMSSYQPSLALLSSAHEENSATAF